MINYVKLKLVYNCSLSLPIFPLASFFVEKLAERKRIPEPVSISYMIMLICPKILICCMFPNSNLLFLVTDCYSFSNYHNNCYYDISGYCNSQVSISRFFFQQRGVIANFISCFISFRLF